MAAATSTALCLFAEATQEIVLVAQGEFVARDQMEIQVGVQQLAVKQVQWAGPNAVVPGSGGVTGMRRDGVQVAAGGVAIEDTAAADALKHFQDKDWFKAIASIETLGESGDAQLVTDPTGVLRPVSSLRRSLLEALPEEGRQIFRQLNAAASQAKLDEALKLESVSEQGRALESVLSRYALCDAAATAASRLGDLRFEAGRFDEAVDLYRRAAEHPGSAVDDPRLMAKRLHALARAERWSGFDALAEYAAFRHPQATVQLGGEAVTLVQVLSSLTEFRNGRPADALMAGRRELPDATYPTFSIPLTDESTDRVLLAAAVQNNFGGRIDNLLHPTVVAGPGRFYALHLDSVTAFDAETGSELWQDGEARANAQRITGNFHYLQMDYQQHIVLHQDTLLVTNSDPENMNWSRLRVIDVKTGEVQWNSKSIGAIQSYSFVGRPIVVGDQVMAVARENAGAELKLIGLSRANGGLAWQVALGTATPDPQWNQPVDISPRLVMGERYLMVLTNNGGVVAIDMDTKAIAWAFAFPVLPTGRMRRGGFDLDAAGDIVAHRGIVYFKDTRDNNLHAIREYDATRLWSVPVDRDDTLVHSDDRRLYLLGEQLTAYDVQTGERQWWSPHAGEEAGRPLFTVNDALLFGQRRSCRIDLATGKVTDYRSDLSGGNYRGAIVEAGQMLGFADRDWLRIYRMPLNPSATPDQPNP